MDTIKTSPETTPVGLLMDNDELLVLVTTAVVAAPLGAICAFSSKELINERIAKANEGGRK
jgi:hypothetical protein